MSIFSTFSLRCKALLADTSRAKDLPNADSQLTQTLARISASGLVIASAGFGAVYAWQSGSTHGWLLGFLTVLFAVALECIKPLAVASACQSFRTFAFGRGVALGMLALVAVAYSLTSELSLMAGSRGDLAAKRGAVVTQAEATRERYDSARSELATLAPSRPKAETEAEIARLFAESPKAGDCSVVDGPVSKSVCPKVATFKGEIARAERRAELQAIVQQTTANLATGETVKAADPGSHAIAIYLAALGITVKSSVLAEWLVLVPVIALELGSALAALLVQSVSSAGVQWHVQAGVQVAANAGVQPPTEQSGSVPQIPSKHRVPAALNTPERKDLDDDSSPPGGTRANVVKLLESKKGRVHGSQRGLAALIGTSATRLNQVLRELADAGIVRLDTSRSGTSVALVAA